MDKLINLSMRVKMYYAVFTIRFNAQIQYRTSAFSGLVTHVFFGLVMIMVLEAFYSSAANLPSFSLSEAITYIWLGQAFLSLLPWNSDSELDEVIRSGSISIELLRPINLYSYWFVKITAMRIGSTIWQCIPLIFGAFVILPLIGLDRWQLLLPPSFDIFLLWVFSMCLAVILGTAITVLLHISSIWIILTDGLFQLVYSLVIIGSGMIIPLPLYPDWLQPVFTILPFRGLVDIPNRIFSGNLHIAEALPFLLVEIVWIFLIIYAGRLLLHRGYRRIVINGG